VLLTAQSYDEYGTVPRSIVRRSLDGGRSWHVLWTQRGGSVTKLAFVSPAVGLVVDERNYAGPSGGCTFQRIRATLDAGRTWTTRSLPYSVRECSSGGTGGGTYFPTAFVGLRHAWAGDEGAGVVWRTSDGARSWRASANPATLGYTLVGGTGIALSPRGVVAESAVGPALSDDGGQTWVPAVWPSQRAIALAQRRNAFLRYRSAFAADVLVAADSDGRSWRRLPLASLPKHVNDVAFRSPRDGLAAAGQWGQWSAQIHVTRDGGASWRQLPGPKGRRQRRGDAAGVGPGIALLSPTKKDSGWISTDEGRSWRRFGVAGDSCWQVSRPAREEIWVQCEGRNDASVLLRTTDGGKTWTRRQTSRCFDEVAVVGAGEAWATADPCHMPDWYKGVSAKVWRTTDGARTWNRVWIQIDPHAPVRALGRGLGKSW
jgi:photosystem II stability/assembly factor-like uncharacterized protein